MALGNDSNIYEIMFERTRDNLVRAIIFVRDGEARGVADIIETPYASDKTIDRILYRTPLSNRNLVLHERYNDIDFGRKRSFKAKAQFIIDEVMF